MITTLKYIFPVEDNSVQVYRQEYNTLTKEPLYQTLSCLYTFTSFST